MNLSAIAAISSASNFLFGSISTAAAVAVYLAPSSFPSGFVGHQFYFQQHPATSTLVKIQAIFHDLAPAASGICAVPHAPFIDSTSVPTTFTRPQLQHQAKKLDVIASPEKVCNHCHCTHLYDIL